jgi:hypothetical protein
MSKNPPNKGEIVRLDEVSRSRTPEPTPKRAKSSRSTSKGSSRIPGKESPLRTRRLVVPHLRTWRSVVQHLQTWRTACRTCGHGFGNAKHKSHSICKSCGLLGQRERAIGDSTNYSVWGASCMYDFDGGRHWSNVADDNGSSGMGAACMACLDGDWHRRVTHSCGCRDYGAICMAFLDGGWHRYAH